MQPLTRTVYIVTTEVEAVHEAEFNRWYDEEHLPALLGVPGYRSGRRYRAVEGEPPYMAFWQIDSLDAYRSDEHDRASDTPWSRKLAPYRKAKLDFYEQRFPAEGVVEGVSAGEAEGGLLTVRVEVAPEHEQDLRDWYDQEHLAALAAVPGVRGCRRFEAVQGDPKFMAVYSLTSPAVLASDAWAKAIDTPWSERNRNQFVVRQRGVYVPYVKE